MSRTPLLHPLPPRQDNSEQTIQGKPDALGLGALADEATVTLAPPPPDEGEAGPGEAPGRSNADALMMAGQVIRETLVNMAKLKTPATTMADDKLQPAADAVGAVLDKHGVSLSDLGGEYMLEIQAAIALGVVAIPTWLGVRAEIAAAKRQDGAAKTAQPPADGVGAETAPDAVQAEFPPDDPRSQKLG